MTTQPSHFSKTLPAYLAALGMTALIALCILAFGLNALLNRSTVPVQATAPKSDPAVAGQVTVQSLQEQIAQYQARETQFQSQLQQAADQINQLSLQNQQYQAYQDIVTTLENAGVIQIAGDGSIIVNRAVGASALVHGETESDGD